MSNDLVHIVVKSETREELRIEKARRGTTYDGLLRDLLDENDDH